MICCWKLPVLGMHAPGRGCAANRGQLPLVLCLRWLNPKYTACRGQPLLVWGLWTVERCYEIPHQRLRPASREEQRPKAVTAGGAGSLGITRVGQVALAKLMETQIWCPPVSWVRKGLAKEQWRLPALQSPARAAPPILKPDKSVSPFAGARWVHAWALEEITWDSSCSHLTLTVC